jgi:serine/threonine-protein kinase
MSSIDQFRIEKELFPGTKRKFSRVFKGVCKLTGQAVLIKSCTNTPSAPQVAERLRQERKFHFELAGLPEVLAFFESENEVILVKKWHEGNELNHYLSGYKSRDRAKALLPVLEALEPLLNYIHQQGIVHLDLKPHNILIDTVEGATKVSLLDFGMAIQQPHHEERGILFPLGYAAPECLLNELDLCDHRSDYFSLGVTFWHCIEGRLPLLHPNPSITTNLQLTHPPPDGDALSKKQSQILRKLSAKHQFAIPPNRMEKQASRAALIEGMNQRYSQFSEFVSDWTSVCEAKSWWRF